MADELDTRGRLCRDASDLEDTLNRAVNMASIAVMLLTSAFTPTTAMWSITRNAGKKTIAPHLSFIHKQDEETLLWTIYELHAEIRSARDQFCGTDDDAPEKAVAEATADQLTPE
jgi:hypothetical protein